MDNVEDVFDVFADEMRKKYKAVMDKPGNVPDPWDHFSIQHNKDGLCQEILKWHEHERPEDLVDMANRAMFIWLKIRLRGLVYRGKKNTLNKKELDALATMKKSYKKVFGGSSKGD